MLNDMLDVQAWHEAGYKSLVFSGEWRAAVLNDVQRFYRENINELQKHNTSDELFILLKGCCYLLIGEKDANGSLKLTEVLLKPEVFYTIKKGVWHSHILEKGTSVAVIEDKNVGPDNTEYMPINLSEFALEKQGE